jgi:hypothetical protein
MPWKDLDSALQPKIIKTFTLKYALVFWGFPKRKDAKESPSA